jgi:hypothetical protein
LWFFAGITGAPAFYVPQDMGASWVQAGMPETRLRAETPLWNADQEKGCAVA